MRPRTTDELERSLADQLKRVRLVAEIGIDESLRRELADALTEVLQLTARDPETISRVHPAILVCYMVAEGIYGYEAGGFFANQSVRQVDHAFSRPTVAALRRLGLEDFDDLVAEEKARPYLTPILAHGGIPKYCLGDFFTLLLRDLGRGVTDASELLTLWRTRKTRFQGIDKPVERFLLHGGGLAIDLIDRCIDLVGEHDRTGTIPSSVDLGLPSYVVETFAELPEKKPGSLFRTSTTYPRPRLAIDPWDPRGPMLELPPVPSSVRGTAWLVYGSDQLRRYHAVPAEPRLVLLRPARSWACELHGASGLLRRSNFEGLDPVPALFFNPADGQAASIAAGLRLAEAWILCPAGTDITATSNSSGDAIGLDSPQELPQPAGDWRGFTLIHVSLDGVGALTVTSARDASVHRLRVVSPRHRPRLSNEPVPGVTTQDGLPVYAAVPSVMLDGAGTVSAGYWRIRVHSGGETAILDAAELSADDAGVRIDSVLSDDGPRRVDLVVQGPLGSDLRTSFAVVPGLDVRRSARIACPGDPSEPITATAGPDVIFVDQQVADRATLVAADGSDHAACEVRGSGGERLVLRVGVNRLLWGLTRSDDPATGLHQRLDVVHADELVDGIVTALLVRTGVPEARVAIMLRSAFHLIQWSDEARTSGTDGRWIFDLARFRDSVRTSNEPRLELVLVIEGRAIPVAEVRAPLELGPISVYAGVEDNLTTVTLEFDEHRALRNRVARLWSLDRVWEAPISHPIAEDRIGSAEIGPLDNLPPGGYLVEVAIDDGWARPSRPRSGSQNTVSTQIGTTDERNARLRALEGDGDPLAVLEVAAATGTISRHLGPEELTRIACAAFDAACGWIEEGDEPATTSAQFNAICDLLFADPACLAQRIVDDISEAKHSRATVLAFCIETVHRARPLSEGNVDDGVMRRLWLSAPVLAAGLDVDRDPMGDRAARCDEFLGWSPDEGSEAILPGEAVKQVMIGIEAAQLEEIQRSIELVPQHLLRIDALVAANFEWLLASKTGRAEQDRWWSHARWLVDHLDQTPDVIARHLEARRPGRGCVDWAAFPQATLAAAIHTVRGSDDHLASVRALRQAAGFASSIVTRDLVLAVALLRTALRKEKPE